MTAPRVPLSDETTGSAGSAGSASSDESRAIDSSAEVDASSVAGEPGPGDAASRVRRRSSKVLLVIALIVVAIVIAVGVFVFMQKGGTPNAAPAGSQPGASAGPSQGARGASNAPTAAPTDAPISAFDASAPLQKNVDLFNRTAAAVAASGSPVGADFTNALAAVGFDKSQMQITADRTTINAVAPAIVFAVKVHDKCLLGQYAPATHEYDHQVVDPISTGSCLIGDVSAPQ